MSEPFYSNKVRSGRCPACGTMTCQAIERKAPADCPRCGETYPPGVWGIEDAAMMIRDLLAAHRPQDPPGTDEQESE